MLLRVSALFAMLYWSISLSGGVHLPPPSGGAVVQLLRRPQESKQIDFGEQYPDRAGDEQQQQEEEQKEVPPSRSITRGEPAWLHSGLKTPENQGTYGVYVPIFSKDHYI